jgi:hypothetical protein
MCFTELQAQINHERYQTTTLEERGHKLISKKINIDVLKGILCDQNPPETYTKIHFENNPREKEGKTEDDQVNEPTHKILRELLPEMFESQLTCKSSPLVHNMREHRVDIIIKDGSLLTWSSAVMFGEGKIQLKGNPLMQAIGQCSQRTYAFMEETQHDYLTVIEPRNVVWAFFCDETNIGFYCRRRNENTSFPFNLPPTIDKQCLEVCFDVVSFRKNGTLEIGGKLLWQLLRTPKVLGYENKESSQPTIALQACHRTSWQCLNVISQRVDEKTGELRSAIIAVKQSRDSFPQSEYPTHVVKLLSSEEFKSIEVEAYDSVENVENVARLVNKEIQCSVHGQSLYGFVIQPYGHSIVNSECDQIPILARRIGSAIRGLHSNNVIHRDITPNNIMSSSEGNYFLIDFNAAYLKDSHYYDPQDSFVGTRRWASLRRQKGKSGKYPRPSPLDDWESFCLTLMDLSGVYDQISWLGFQGFSSSVLPNIPVESPAFFLVNWYKHLVECQTKTLPKLEGFVVLADTLLPMLP